MKALSYRPAMSVDALPAASAQLAGLTLALTTDNNNPYWCNGTEWVNLNTVVAGGAQEVFVQSTQPLFTGQPYLWIQTGLPNGGFSLWFHDGVA